MVVKRQCSFCADEIEPGTGIMYVKKDGSVFHFCSTSCRKQQMVLGRVGHRMKWTRAHALRRAQTASNAARASASAAPAAPKPPAELEAPPAKAPTPPPAGPEEPKKSTKPRRKASAPATPPPWA
jgi:large subunit ribosomal protein L24e